MIAGSSANTILRELAGLAVVSSEESFGVGATIGGVVQRWQASGARDKPQVAAPGWGAARFGPRSRSFCVHQKS